MSDHPPGWHPDPTGRHQHRYWDGTQWTDNVADQGQMTLDPVMASPQTVSAPAEPSRVDLPAIDPSQIVVTGSMPAITPQQATPAGDVPATPEPEPEPEPVTPEPAAATSEPEPVSAFQPAATGTGRHPVLGGLLSIAAPGSGHQYLGRRPQIGFGLLGAFVVAIIVGWFISWPIGAIVYLAAAGFALFDLRSDVMPAARSGEAALDAVDDPLAWRIMGAGGVLLVVGLLLPWYRIAADVSVAGTSQSTTLSANGFESFGLLDILLLLLGLAAVAVAAIHITQSSNARSALPPALPLVLAGLGAVAWLFVVYRILDIPGDAGAIGDLDGVGGAEVDVTYGRVDYAGALAVAAGAWAVARK